MKKTDNYSLPQWEKQDFIKMEDFNDAFSRIDAALKANADAAATGLRAEIAARGEAVAAEAENRSAALAALSKNLGAAGHNARIAWGSYTGTGTTGAASPNTLQFDFKPMLVFVAIAKWDGGVNNPTVLMRPRTVGTSRPILDSNSQLNVTWGDKSVSWYKISSEGTAYSQLNNLDSKYLYTVIGYDEQNY